MPQYELNLRDYWQVMQKRRLTFIIIFAAIFISSIIYTNLQTPVYQASASVQWIERKTVGSMLAELVTVSSSDPLATQARIITSLPVLEKVAVELGLADKNAAMQEITEQAEGLRGLVAAETITDTNIIRIIVNHDNPQMTADIANKVADVYIAENLKEKTKESRAVREFIERQLEELNLKLKNSEEALSKFRAAEAPSGIVLSLENRLAGLETERQNLLQKYTLRHPNIVSIDEQIGQIKEQLKALPEKELDYSRLVRDVEINAAIYRQLKEKLEAARISEAEKTGDASPVDRAVVPIYPVSPNKPLNYLLGAVIGLMLGLAATFVVEQLDTSIGTIEDVENYMKLPALGVIPYIRTKKDEKRKRFPFRLFPEKLKGEERILRLKRQLLVNYPSSAPIFEAYRILRTGIQTEVFKEKIQGKVLMVTSSGPEEGKSITAANLAITMAQGNLRTLLIDADMRRSTLHKIFGLKSREPGLSDILRGVARPEEAIRTFTDILMGELGFDETLKVPGLDALNILTSGSLATQPAELLSSGEMTALLNNLREKFDLILIDSPPVLAVADATILASKVDGIILVYLVGKTARSILGRTKTQLNESGGQVKGIILNNISPEIEMRYGYAYQNKYYGKYYGEQKKEGA